MGIDKIIKSRKPIIVGLSSTTLKNYERNQMYIDEIKHFIKCVKSRKKTVNSLDDGIKTLNIALAMKKSATYKKIIKLT